MHTASKRGFTLIEMIMVIAIIALLALVVYGALASAREKGRDTKRHAEIGELALALRLYAEQHDAFPSYASGIKLGEGGALDETLDQFMTVPHDPSGPEDSDLYYFYDSSVSCPLAGGTKAVVYANQMESENRGNWTSVCDEDGPDTRYGVILN